MTVDVHHAVIGHGIVALEPQLNGVHVELALFEVFDPPRARRILGRVGIPEGNGRELRRVAAIHLLPALIRDLVLVGIGNGDRRGRARRLAGRVVGLHVVDVQVMEGFVFRCNKRNFTIDDVAEVIIVPGFVDDSRAAFIVSSGILQCRANIESLIARESIRAACRATRKGQRQPHVIANRLKAGRHIGHGRILNFDQSARSGIGPVALNLDDFARKRFWNATLNIGKIIGIRLALFECDIARKRAVRVAGNHGRIDPNVAAANNIGHTAGHDGVIRRRGGVVAGSILFSGCRIVGFIGGASRGRLLRLNGGLRRRSSIGCRRGRSSRCGRCSRILRNRRRHRSRGNLIRPSGGIGAFRRQRHARQQQLTDHKRTRAGASYFGTHTTPGTVNQRAGGLTLSLLVKVAYVHNGLLGRRDIPPRRCLSPLWWSCTTKMCQMTPYA